MAAADLAASPALLPATSTWTSGSICDAAVTALATLLRTVLPSCAATTRTAMSDHSRFVTQLVYKLGHGLHLDAALALGRLLDLQHLEPGRDVDAQRVGGQDLDRLLLGLHDVGQRGVARLVEAQVGGDHRRQLDLDVLQDAVDLALDLGRAIGDVQLVGEGALRPAEKGGQHLAGLVGVVVDRLLADDHEARLLLVDHGLQELGDGERLELGVGLDEDAAVGAHGERGADRLLALQRAGGKGDDLGRGPLLFHTERLFHGDLVEGVHRHLDVGRLDAGVVGLYANLDVVVDDPLDRDQ